MGARGAGPPTGARAGPPGGAAAGRLAGGAAAGFCTAGGFAAAFLGGGPPGGALIGKGPCLLAFTATALLGGSPGRVVTLGGGLRGISRMGNLAPTGPGRRLFRNILRFLRGDGERE